MNDTLTIFPNRENEPPNQTVVTTILKEVKEIDQIKNDSLCTERRILGMLSFSSHYCTFTNLVQGPYCKLWTKVFPFDLWVSIKAVGQKLIGREEEITIVTCTVFIISLLSV